MDNKVSGQPTSPSVSSAPRPHPWTIALGLLSPTLSLVAVGISLFSVSLNTASLKIGQRAYVVIRNSTIVDRPFQAIRAGEETVTFQQNFDIVNSGNTPGYVTSLMTTCVCPEGWSLDPATDDPDFSEYVGRSSSVQQSRLMKFVLSAAAAQEWREQREEITSGLRAKELSEGSAETPMEDITLTHKMTVTDVFDDVYEVTWDDSITVLIGSYTLQRWK